MKKPLYTHDCDNCKFLGTNSKKLDLYFCSREKIPVVRRSSRGSDYSSGMDLKYPEIKEAIKIATKLKMIQVDSDK